MFKMVNFGIVGLLAIALAPPAQANGTASAAIKISAYVPEYCTIHPSAFNVQGGNDVLIGQVLETCNHTRGFDIVARHRALAPGEAIDLVYGDVTVRLDKSGSSPVVHRYGPRRTSVPVKVVAHNLVQPLNLSFALNSDGI